MHRILACGSRDWTSGWIILKALNICLNKYGDFHLIHGNCSGADKIAGQIAADDMDMIVTAVPAKWATHGKAAGPIRNSRMLEIGKPDLVIAFHAEIKRSRGTRDMMSKAEKAGVPVVLVRGDADLINFSEKLPDANV